MDRYLDDVTKPLPILARIADWDPWRKPMLADWLNEIYASVLNETFLEEITFGKSLILLDGLDELGSKRPVNPEKLYEAMFDPRPDFIKMLPENNQIVLTCRIQDFEIVSDKLKLNGAVVLQPLTDAQIEDYLSTQPELLEAIGQDSGLRELVRSPLLLSNFAYGVSSVTSKTRRLTSLSVIEVRDEIFLQYLKRRYDHEQKKQSQKLTYTFSQLIQIWGLIATWDTADWLEHKAMPNGGFTDTDIMHLDLTINSSEIVALSLQFHVFRKERGQTYQFSHLLLREFLATDFAPQGLGIIEGKHKIASGITLLRLNHPNTLNYALDLVNHDSAEVRENIAALLGNLKNRKTIKSLIKLSNDRAWNVRYAAVYSLRQLKTKSCRSVLIKALDDRHAKVRACAAEGVGELKLIEAVPRLMSQLADRNPEVRGAALYALDRIGDTHSVNSITALLDDDETVLSGLLSISYMAETALKHIGTPEAIAALENWRRTHGESDE